MSQYNEVSLADAHNIDDSAAVSICADTGEMAKPLLGATKVTMTAGIGGVRAGE